MLVIIISLEIVILSIIKILDIGSIIYIVVTDIRLDFNIINDIGVIIISNDVIDHHEIFLR